MMSLCDIIIKLFLTVCARILFVSIKKNKKTRKYLILKNAKTKNKYSLICLAILF